MSDEPAQPTPSTIGLADAIEALRAELSEAMSRAKHQPIQFPVGETQVEFQAGITREREGEGGLRVWVLELRGGGRHTNESAHKVTVTLQPPVTADGQAIKVHRDYEGKP